MRRTITLILISLLLSLSACGSEKAPEGGLSAMETEDIYGTPCTSEVFKENKVTLVNVFATWCTPCIAEFPHLEQLPAAVEKKYFSSKIPSGVCMYLLLVTRLMVLSCISTVSAMSLSPIGFKYSMPFSKKSYWAATIASLTLRMVVARWCSALTKKLALLSWVLRYLWVSLSRVPKGLSSW